MATKIYIDQGHNPQNPNAGAEGNGYREQDLVYVIGRILADILQNYGFETRLSRKTPGAQLGTSNATSLATRVNEANSWGADYFISLHTNASVNPSASGSEALVFSLSSPAYPLAESILEQLNLSTGLRNRGVVPRPGLYILKKTRMPAVLIELGFITNPNDASLMANSPELFAQGVADGIVDYVNDSENVSSIDVYDVFEEVDSDQIADPTPPTQIPIQNENPNEDETPLDISETEYESYTDFIRENSRRGMLKVQASRAEQSIPVSGVKIRVSKDIGGREYVFFEGYTDRNGIIDGVELPAPPRGNSLSSSLPDKTVTYLLNADIPSYLPIAIDINVYEGIKTIQPLSMMLEVEN